MSTRDQTKELTLELRFVRSSFSSLRIDLGIIIIIIIMNDLDNEQSRAGRLASNEDEATTTNTHRELFRS